MKNDFEFFNPTQVFFGRSAMENLSSVLSLYGDRVLLAYGSGSIRRNGVYDQVMNTLQACGKTVTEFSGILPNPTYEKVLEGGRLARASQADLILAVGGGSVIDCAKGVAIAAVEEGDIWTKYWQNKQPLDCTPLPIGAVLTMVGTGSEMDGDAVITHEATKRKTSCWDYSLYPQFAILNPEFTYSVPEYQMVSGIFDTLSHIMEIYFSPEDEDNISDDFAEALMRSIIRNTPVAIANPRDYVARSNLMWASAAFSPLQRRRTGKCTRFSIRSQHTTPPPTVWGWQPFLLPITAWSAPMGSRVSVGSPPRCGGLIPQESVIWKLPTRASMPWPRSSEKVTWSQASETWVFQNKPRYKPSQTRAIFAEVVTTPSRETMCCKYCRTAFKWHKKQQVLCTCCFCALQ